MIVRRLSEVVDRMSGRLGWHRQSGDDVFENPRYGRISHVAICNDEGEALWDQPFFFVSPGAIVVPINSLGEYGLIWAERPTVKDAKYYTFPNVDLSQLGVISLEFPRGFSRKGETSIETALREGEEELGVSIIEAVLIGELTPDTASNPYRIPVFMARINEGQASTLQPDPNEKILQVEWVSEDELRARIANGEIYCAMTLAAFSLAQARKGPGR